jgi:hypothetical protein
MAVLVVAFFASAAVSVVISAKGSSGQAMQKLLALGLMREARAYRDFYRENLRLQRSRTGDRFDVFFALVSGDSSDDTSEWLEEWATAEPARVAAVVLDTPVNGSWRDRVNFWADLVNVAVERGLRLCPECKHVLFAETDVSLPLDTVSQLLASKVDMIAPWVLYRNRLYDTWGFRALDQAVDPKALDARALGGALLEMASVGTVALMRRELLDGPRGTRFRGCKAGQTPDMGGLDHVCDGLFRGFCTDVRARGFRVFANPSVVVMHPDRITAQRYSLTRISTKCCKFGKPVETCHASSFLRQVFGRLQSFCPTFGVTLYQKSIVVQRRGCFPQSMLVPWVVNHVAQNLCGKHCVVDVVVQGLEYFLVLCTSQGMTSEIQR